MQQLHASNMRFIKHENNTDIAFEILDDRTIGNTDTMVLFGHWWNIAFPEPFPMYQGNFSYVRPCREVIRIRIQDYSKWKEFETAEDARAYMLQHRVAVKDLG